MKKLKLSDWLLLIIPPFGIWHTIFKKDTFLTPTQVTILLIAQVALFAIINKFI